MSIEGVESDCVSVMNAIFTSLDEEVLEYTEEIFEEVYDTLLE
jgi:hypothetical protein